MKTIKRIIFTGALTLLYFNSAVAQVCPYNKIAPDSRYVDKGDGTIIDKYTSLMWAKCSIGQDKSSCRGVADKMNWKAALNVTKNANDAPLYLNHSDWRLPNIKELNSLVEYGCSNPGINNNIFPHTINDYYWSSSIDSKYQDYAYAYAWSVDFGVVFIYQSRVAGDFYVRLVRDGQ